MHPFHYFIPGVNSRTWCPGGMLSSALLAERHLGHLSHLAKAGKATILDAKVCGVEGVMFTPILPGGKSPEHVQPRPEQAWLKATDKVWIGWEADQLPGPELLKREKFIANGYKITDNNGNQWLIPVARSPVGGETLPQDIKWDIITGKPSKVRKPCYDFLWTLAQEVYDFWNNKSQQTDPMWIEQQALICLQVNYAIGPLELEAFREAGQPVLDEVFATMVTMALIDRDIVNQVEESKKNG